MLEGYAEYYSAELSEKVKRGMTENALKAKSNGVRPPFGYYVDDTDHYQIDETISPIIKEIFNLYVDGVKITEIASKLKERGDKNRGYELNYNAIFRILTNRKYIGEYKFGETVIPDAIPAIIDEQTFNAVQQRMARNKKAPAMHRSEDDYLLTTNVICAKGQHKILKAAELNVDQSRNPISDYGFPINLFFIINFTINICFYLQ